MGSALDRLLKSGKGQQGTPFEASQRVERNTRDLNIFAKHNDNEACSSIPKVAKQIEGEITIPQAIENTVVAMRGQAGILKSISMSVTQDGLSMMTKAYASANNHSIDVAGLYGSNKDYKNFVNAMASGFIVTAGIEGVISNPVKLYFKTALDGSASDLNMKAGYEFKGNLPTISTFDSDSINRVQAFVRTVASQVSTSAKGLSLFEFINLKGNKFEAPSIKDNNILSDKVVLSSMDVRRLAEFLTLKFPDNLDEGLMFARQNNVDENKLQKVSMLIKAVRDYNN